MRAAIFLNGKHPSIRIIRRFIQGNCLIIAADGGGNYLYKKKIIPDSVIGDMDSLDEDALRFFRKRKSAVIHIREQETTDFEKCLNYCVKNKIREALVFGATSMRPDHTMNNFSVMKRFRNKLLVRLITEEFEIFFAAKDLEFEYPRHETISLIGIPTATCVTTKGLRYRLNNEDLTFGHREGSLNQSISGKIKITHKSGDLLVFRKHFLN